MPSSKGASPPRDRTQVSCVSSIGRWILYHCTTWEVHTAEGFFTHLATWEARGAT